MLNWLATNWTEVLGFSTGLACVWLATRRNVLTFPIGIANNVVFIVLFVPAALYADVALQLVYLVLGVTGWVGWRRAHRREDEAGVDFVRVARWPELAAFVGAGVVATAIIAWLLGFTDSSTRVADAATTSFSLVAQVMLNRRVLQNWVVWILVDVAFVGLFAVKGLWITAALYLVFIGLCVAGLRGWLRHHREQQELEAARA